MDKLVVTGGHRLQGEVAISGSKNATLPILAATLLCNGESSLKNVPLLADVRTMLILLAHLGTGVRENGKSVFINGGTVSNLEATYDIVRTMRASVLVLGPLVSRFGRARVSMPGGCAIGARPIDLHLKGLLAMGAEIRLEHGYVDVSAPAGGLCGARIPLTSPSVTGTENLMMAATLARGSTLIENAACEPEIIELAEALSGTGAKIYGAGTPTIEIEGVDCLQPISHTIGPDRIEAGTFIAMAAMTRGEIVLRGARPDHMVATIEQFTRVGCKIEVLGRSQLAQGCSDLKVVGPERMLAANLRTAPYPGFPTDMQAQFMACMALAEGTSQIEETIFENRFMHILELVRMGANISLVGNLAVVKGCTKLSGAPVMATDLRASAGLVIAALMARGISEILRVYHLDRGYTALEKKLSLLGGRIHRAAE